ncbi:MAG: flagellar biosynthesis repressor FlbT [Planctomycetota bacterium]
MPGLILKLGPGERFMVNGVVMENGTRRTRINILTADSHVLRLRDAIHPGEATTPVRRVCYIAQLVLAGEAEPEEAEAQIRSGIDQLAQVFTDVDSHERLSEARAELEEGRFYQALKSLRKLLPLEERLMGAPNP